ncbi:MAG TPA: class I adenylate-forming enzyme family protein [Steroidobacteraceae bacterium]|jgi:acyl-CoA synthetase (AMP-forming)/AMP-acid ligase II|nr:class I adenylate-forming enzyme family protein [Steroidobacteraceae bacterium]
MFLDLNVGSLVEPITGRRWDRRCIQRELYHRLAYFQDHGLAPADLVFIHHGNTAEFFVDLLAIWSLGGCAIPLDPRLSQFEIQTLAQAARPRFSLWHDGPGAGIGTGLSALGVKVLQTAAPAQPDASVQPRPYSGSLLQLDRPALILFTSGTTGQPKGVVHTHRSLRARWMSLRQCLGIETFRRTLCLLPTHFGHGLICNCLFPWLSGQDLFILPPFRPDIVLQLGSLLDQNDITCMSSVPSTWRLALQTARPPRLATLEQVMCGSAPLSAFLWQGIREWTGTHSVLNAYGITETGSWVAGTTVRDVALEDGLIGLPWGAVARILKSSSTEPPPDQAAECGAGESGYVWLNTPALMQGYLGRDDLTAQVVSQGWFFTGDIGLIDDRGLLYLRGREREEINKGGMKVYPSDIDAVAERYQHTIDVCSFGYEEALHGENIGIAVVLEPGGDEHFRGLYHWLQQHLAQFQMPQRWYVMDKIPRSSRGKINRSQLAKTCAALTAVDHRGIVRGGN